MSSRAAVWLGGVAVLAVLLGAPESSRAAEPATPAKSAAPAKPAPVKPWTVKMRGLEQTLQELLLDVSSDQRFNAKANYSRIEKNADKLAKLAHELKTDPAASPDADPSIGLIAGQFATEADHAAKTLKWGHRAYARQVLKSMTGYCLACHTRTGTGPRFSGADTSPLVKQLKGLERADYLAATRQFDPALDEYERIVAEPGNAEHRPFDWERAVRSGLAVAVRVKKDPDRALSLVDRVLAAPKAALFLREQALQWKESIKAWKEEPVSQAMTEEGYHAQAIRLLTEARKVQRYPADRSADLLYLRASSAVHDLLAFAPNGAYATEGLYLAGLCYEVLHDLNLWDMQDLYFISCISKSPHTDLARQCYRHYEESIYLGYSGSSGAHLPTEISDRLQELKGLANPSETKP